MADHNDAPSTVNNHDPGSETEVELPSTTTPDPEKHFKSTDESGNETAETASIEKAKEAGVDAPPPEEPLQRQITGIRFFFVISGILSSTFLFSLGKYCVVFLSSYGSR